MALSPTNDAALLQEVDEAVRKDRLDTIMQNYGRWIVGGVLAALLAFGGYLFWSHRQDVARGEQAEQLIAAFEKLQSNQPRAAAAELQKLEADGDPAYGAVAAMQQANIKAQTGDLKAAAALMAKVAADTKLDQSLRDLALIRQTAFEYDTLKPAAVIARLKPMVDAKDPASSWFASAAELSATAHYQLGQFDQAGALYGRIAKTPGVAKSLESRAVQMAGMLGVDAVADRASESAAADKTGAAQAAAGDQKGSAAPKAAAAGKAEEVN
ncbi:MAG TPA: tetratricopeptide repeat protein [Sphingopyxis sp.]|uniref:tetratricopeptide repeat protein n=1 Tax=Sphingopyxis sp. TaxID=1908224 RepID=UPI002BECDD6D|nr:tetratricopeptide repeat protein [Sphingopyxis sp.]HWW56165.1 tetratricopeptide repeat protein [Sphingopyxis sp.]